MKAYITETYSSGSNWYRVYSDGWIEQGGKVLSAGLHTSVTVNLHKAFTNTSKVIALASSVQNDSNGGGDYVYQVHVRISSTTTIKVSGECQNGIYWYACGY